MGFLIVIWLVSFIVFHIWIRRDSIGSEDEQTISYCPHCEQYGFKQVLGPRILMKGEPIPRDHDQWLQCRSCGIIIPIYEVKKESKLQDFVETSDNPFNQGK